jgi:hypothetical protein
VWMRAERHHKSGQSTHELHSPLHPPAQIISKSAPSSACPQSAPVRPLARTVIDAADRRVRDISGTMRATLRSRAAASTRVPGGPVTSAAGSPPKRKVRAATAKTHATASRSS